MSNSQVSLPALDAGIHFSGNPSGELVLLFHSSLSTAGQWKGLVKELNPDFLCVAVDSVGYGQAPKREKLEGYQLLDEAKRAAMALQKAGFSLSAKTKIHLVGHSFGAAIALRFAAEYRACIKSLSIFEPVAFHLLDPSDSGFQEVQQVDADVFSSEQDVAAVRFYEYWNGAGNFAKLPSKIQQRFARLMPVVTSDFHALMHCEKTLDDYQEFDFPKLLMFGNQTRHSAKQVIAALQQRWPDATTVSVDGGHMSPVLTPDAVNPHIAKFIRQ